MILKPELTINSKCAISQPTYLPYIGYFNLINSVDKFIFLDNVNFSAQSWQSRNYIFSKENKNNKLLLTVPVYNNTGKLIKDIKISNDKDWRKKHIKSITQTYSKHKFFDNIAEIIHIISNKNFKYLIDLNTAIITTVSKNLKFKTQFFYSSELINSSTEISKTERLILLLKLLDSKTYVSVVGAKSYLELNNDFNKNNIDIVYNLNNMVNYLQKNNKKDFIENLSILDILANLGYDNLKNYLDSLKNDMFPV